jgi:hypothetical protein
MHYCHRWLLIQRLSVEEMLHPPLTVLSLQGYYRAVVRHWEVDGRTNPRATMRFTPATVT